MLGGAEHAPCVGNRLPKLQQRGVHLLEACLVPVGDFECAGTLLTRRERILQGVDLLEILRFAGSTSMRTTTMPYCFPIPSLVSVRLSRFVIELPLDR